MTKVTRYFNKTENPSEEVIIATKPQRPTKKRKRLGPQDVIKIEVDTRKRFWGRRKGDAGVVKKKFLPNPNPRFPGKPAIDEKVLAKHSRGSGLDHKNIKTKFHKKKLIRKEENIKFANEQAARAEILLTEDTGYLEADDGETTTQFTQKQIVESVDISAATKHFELQLRDFGPYRAKYTRNGRHLLLGGKRGHVAAFDWVTKKLHCELNVMETVHDISWLHIETMFAAAQKDWVYIYDNQGVELHCIKQMNKVTRMEFLPYHFLLASCSEASFLSWLDISIGQMVSHFNTHLGRLSLMTHNPYNAILCTGHSKGIVAMWSPNNREPLAKMLCHKSPLSALHVDPKGVYMATAGANKELKIWDIRKLEGPVQTYKVRTPANNLQLSQKHMLAVGMGNIVEVYRDCCSTTATRPYLRQRFNNPVSNMMFCPYEDVLGVATEKGFTSLLVPGAGEANFDALEANPFQTKSQRREAEVKALLEKIQPELISLDPLAIAEVDIPTLKDKMEAKKGLLYLKPPKIDYEPRRKAKGRGGAAKIARNRKIVNEQAKKGFVKKMKEIKEKPEKKTKKGPKKPRNVLDRFLPQTK